MSVWEEPNADSEDLYRRGVIYYLDDSRSVMGVLTINTPEKMDYAKRLVKYGVGAEQTTDALKWIYLGQ